MKNGPQTTGPRTTRPLAVLWMAGLVAVCGFLWWVVPKAEAARGMFPIDGWFSSNIANQASAPAVRSNLGVLIPIPGENMTASTNAAAGTVTFNSTGAGAATNAIANSSGMGTNTTLLGNTRLGSGVEATNLTLRGVPKWGLDSLPDFDSSSELGWIQMQASGVPQLSFDGSTLQTLNASALASGTVPDARLSSNIPRKDGTNIFTGTNTFSQIVINGFKIQSHGDQLDILDDAGEVKISFFHDDPNSGPYLNGDGITNLNGSQILSGTVPSARLPVNNFNTAGIVTAPTAGDVNSFWGTDNAQNPGWRRNGGGLTNVVGATNLPNLTVTNGLTVRARIQVTNTAVPNLFFEIGLSPGPIQDLGDNTVGVGASGGLVLGAGNTYNNEGGANVGFGNDTAGQDSYIFGGGNVVDVNESMVAGWGNFVTNLSGFFVNIFGTHNIVSGDGSGTQLVLGHNNRVLADLSGAIGDGITNAVQDALDIGVSDVSKMTLTPTSSVFRVILHGNGGGLSNAAIVLAGNNTTVSNFNNQAFTVSATAGGSTNIYNLGPLVEVTNPEGFAFLRADTGDEVILAVAAGTDITDSHPRLFLETTGLSSTSPNGEDWLQVLNSSVLLRVSNITVLTLFNSRVQANKPLWITVTNATGLATDGNGQIIAGSAGGGPTNLVNNGNQVILTGPGGETNFIATGTTATMHYPSNVRGIEFDSGGFQIFDETGSALVEGTAASGLTINGDLNVTGAMSLGTGNFGVLNATNVALVDTGEDHSTFVKSGVNLTADRTNTFVFPDSNQTHTFPAASGTIVLNDNTATLSGKTISSATLSGHQTLAENAGLLSDPALSADGQYSPTVLRAGTAGATLAFGDLVVLDVTDSRWELADANSASGADGDARGMIGICVLAAASDGSATVVMLQGFVRADAVFPTFTVNAPLYVSETAGDITATSPTSEDNVVRILGAAVTADEIYFAPDRVWTIYDVP